MSEHGPRHPGVCKYRRYPEYYRIMSGIVEAYPWKGDCGFITTTSASDAQLEAANQDPESVCVNCWKKKEFVYR